MPVGRLLRAQLRRVLLDDPPDEIDPQQQEEAHWFDALHTLALVSAPARRRRERRGGSFTRARHGGGGAGGGVVWVGWCWEGGRGR